MATNEKRRRNRKRHSLSFLLAASRRRESNLLQILQEDPLFRWAFAGVVLLLLALAVLIPKIWIMTPRGFNPVIRISGLDMMQSRSLMRTARKHAETGRTAEAMQAWTAAVVNNPAELDAVQGLLNAFLIGGVVEPRTLSLAVGQGNWLLQLGGTNLADVDLVAQVYRKGQLPEGVIQLLSDPSHPMTAFGAGLLGESYFELGRMNLFDAHWTRHESELASDPRMRLYRAAWSAGWGSPGGVPGGIRALEEASREGGEREHAMHLLLWVLAQRQELAAFEKVFGELQGLRADRMEDHARWWVLLDHAGRREDAMARARAYAVPPRTAIEARLLLGVWARLGLHDLIVGFARQQLGAFTNARALRQLVGRQLIAGQRWEDLRTIAVELRANGRLVADLGGYSHYLEGVAEHGLERRSRAMDSFPRMMKDLPEDPVLNVEMAGTLRRLGYPEFAREIIRLQESALGNQAEYWQGLAQAAHDSRDAETLLAACERGYQLAPGNLPAANNFAAALLTHRRDPAEAIRITLQVLGKLPESRLAQVNHALALAQMGRHADARVALAKLDQGELSAEERTHWALGGFECALAEGRVDEARKLIDQIELRYLFPPQLEWLNTARARMNRPGS